MFTSEVAFSSSNLSRSSGRLLRAQQRESPDGGGFWGVGGWGGRADRPALWVIFIGRSVRSLRRGCFIFRHCCAQPAVGFAGAQPCRGGGAEADYYGLLRALHGQAAGLIPSGRLCPE